MLLTSVPLLDDILQQHLKAMGKDMAGYRNHTYRVMNFCAAFGPDDAESREKMAIAAVFHDLGIWTDKTFDYLDPSERLAHGYLALHGKLGWAPEIIGMIHNHHKITPYRREPVGLIEGFRRADWVDVTRGLLAYGLPKPFIREVFSAFPDAGFRKRLIQLSMEQLRRHPLNPLPMFRL
jgi:hypothetical protein